MNKNSKYVLFVLLLSATNFIATSSLVASEGSGDGECGETVEADFDPDESDDDLPLDVGEIDKDIEYRKIFAENRLTDTSKTNVDVENNELQYLPDIDDEDDWNKHVHEGYEAGSVGENSFPQSADSQVVQTEAITPTEETAGFYNDLGSIEEPPLIQQIKSDLITRIKYINSKDCDKDAAYYELGQVVSTLRFWKSSTKNSALASALDSAITQIQKIRDDPNADIYAIRKVVNDMAAQLKLNIR